MRHNRFPDFLRSRTIAAKRIGDRGQGAGDRVQGAGDRAIPTIQLHKADLGTWRSDRSFRFAVRVPSVSRPCGLWAAAHAKPFRVVRG